MLVEEAKKKKKEQERKQIVGDDTPDWQSVSDKNMRELPQRKDAILLPVNLELLTQTV